jgi:cytoskeletal protein RodZ
MSESIGQQLKKEREARFLTLDKASETTRIRIVFLQALEADDYSVMPSAAQGRGFLRNYAEYLELNIDEMIAERVAQRNASQVEEVSGPLLQVNLAETELPPLVAEEQQERLSWAGKLRVSVTLRLRSVRALWLGFGRADESALTVTESEVAPELVIHEPVAVEEVKEEEPKPRGRKKKKVVEEEPLPQVEEEKAEALTPPVEPNQARPEQGRRAEAQFEAEPESGWGVGKVVRGFFKKKESRPAPELPPVAEPEVPRFVPSQPADVIFTEIGAQLRERRELISLTFDEVERHTKLRAAFVKALEEGAFDKLPSPVQTRGMLANYATFLDLDTEAILLRFADGLQARRHEKYAETPREKIQTEVIASIPLWRNFIAGDLIFGVLMIAVLFALAIWGVGRVVSSQSEENAESTAPSIVEALADVPLPTPSLDASFVPVDENVTATPVAEAAEPQTFNANVTVDIFAVERTFMRVSVDGEQVFEGRMAPGESKVFEGNTEVLVLTGNAAALRVTYNGRDLGLMGTEGEVVSRVYLVSGVATPTATISPTPTNTLPVTSTPTETPTPTVTPEATVTPGG